MHFFHTTKESRHSYLKPDALDKVAYDDTNTPLKPDTIDTPLYEKPNAFDETIPDDTSLHLPLKQSELDDDEEPIHTTIVRYKTWKRKMAPPPPADDSGTETSTKVRPWSSDSLDQQESQTTLSSASSSCTEHSYSFLHRRRRMGDDTIKYDLRKPSLSQPQHHDIYQGKQLVYRKRQTHSYSWGFCNLLYKMMDKEQGIQVAEARRRAFEKDMTVEWGDDDIHQGYPGLIHTNHTRLLFVYKTKFAHDYSIRWKRPSLASHDMVCDIRQEGGTWHRLAEFDSHLMGYLVNIGQLEIDKDILGWMDRPDHLIALLLVTCSTLVDFMREVVLNAIGVSHGGVA